METINFITSVKNKMDKSLKTFYSKKDNLTNRKRYKGLSKTFDEILEIVDDNFLQEAKKYYRERSKMDKKLLAIQNKSIKEIKKCIILDKKDYEIVPASSFSARMNLIGESDIDIVIMIKKMNINKVISISNSLGSCNYKLSDIRGNIDDINIHWVLNKYFDGVEIECKIISDRGFVSPLKMHTYLDNIMDKNKKILATYTKYLLLQEKKAYSNFKKFYYCNAGYHGKSKELIYKLL